MQTKLTFLFLLMMGALLVSQPGATMAQNNENSNGQETERQEQEVDQDEPEQQALPAKEQGKEDKGIFGFFSKLKFWGNSKLPSEKTDWHLAVREYSNANKNEYYRFGYVLSDGKWYSTFFLRRFEHIERQYQHYLYIQGVSSKDIIDEGIEIIQIDYDVPGNRITRISNLGFNYEMPKIPSVSREQKKIDEQRALQLATLQLELLGFTDVFWLPDDRKDNRDVAETWIVNEKSKN